MPNAIETETIVATYDRYLTENPEDAGILTKFTCDLLGVSDDRLLEILDELRPQIDIINNHETED